MTRIDYFYIYVTVGIFYDLIGLWIWPVSKRKGGNKGFELILCSIIQVLIWPLWFIFFFWGMVPDKWKGKK